MDKYGNPNNWEEMLVEAMEERGETLADLVSCTLSAEAMRVEFDRGFGNPEGEPFTAWTANTVYFPLEYDGRETVGSVSRNPDGKPTQHQPP